MSGLSKNTSAASTSTPFDTSSFDSSDPNTWAATADSIWKYLDKLSAKDPIEYNKFIESQKKDALTNAAANGEVDVTGIPTDPALAAWTKSPLSSSENNAAADSTEPSTFVPIPVLVLSTKLLETPAIKPNPHLSAGITAIADNVIFVNICRSPEMPKPKYKSTGKTISESGKELDTSIHALHLPLSVGKPFYCRHDKQLCYGIDVVYHDIICNRFVTSLQLKYWIIELTFQHIESDIRCRCDHKSYRIESPNIKYKGQQLSNNQTATQPTPQLTERGIQRIQERWRSQQRTTSSNNSNAVTAPANIKLPTSSSAADITPVSSTKNGAVGTAAVNTVGGQRVGDTASNGPNNTEPMFELNLRKQSSVRSADRKSKPLISDITSTNSDNDKTSVPPSPPSTAASAKPKLQFDVKVRAPSSASSSNNEPLLQLTQTKLLKSTTSSTTPVRVTATAVLKAVVQIPTYSVDVDRERNRLIVYFDLPLAVWIDGLISLH